MRNITFRAGYYEWLLFIDNKLVYVFGDLFNYGDEKDFKDKKDLKNFIDTCLVCLDDEAKTDDLENTGFVDYDNSKQENKDLWLSLTKQERNAVKKVLYLGWERYL